MATPPLYDDVSSGASGSNTWRCQTLYLHQANRFLSGWGIAKGPWPPLEQLSLCAYRRDGFRILKLSCIQHATRDKDGEVSMHFLFYSETHGNVPSEAEYGLSIDNPDGTAIPLPAPPMGGVKRGEAKTGLPLKHYLAVTAQLIRHRQISVLFRKAVRMAQALLCFGSSPETFMRQATQEGRPLALVIDHDLGGGANTYRSALLRELESEGFLPVLLIAHRGISAYRVEAAFGGRMQSAHAGGMDALFSALSAAPFQKVIFNNILSFPSPWEFVLRLAAWQRKHPPKTFRFLVHDHYSVCPSTFLLDCSNTYCGVPDTDVCATCLPANPAPFIRQAPGHTVESWRSAWAELLAQAHEIRCFSEYSRRILLKAYPDTDGAKLTVVPHSINPALRPVMCSGMNNPVVAVIGHINIYKGNEVVRKVAEHIRASGKAIRLVIVGTFEGKIDSEIVRVTGPYRVEQLPDIVETQGVNVVLFPSICPETFSFVTEEAIQMGLPIIAFDFGAQGERVATYAKGKVIPPLSSAEAIVGAIEELHRFKST